MLSALLQVTSIRCISKQWAEAKELLDRKPVRHIFSGAK